MTCGVANRPEEVRSQRTRHPDEEGSPGQRLSRELGIFARGRIDPERLAGLLGDEAAPDPLTARLMAQAHDLFSGIMTGGRRRFHLQLGPDEDLSRARLFLVGVLGRAFGVAHAVEKAREHRYDPDHDYGLLHSYPFHRWSALERELAPPLVVEVEGRTLRATGLVEFLDGWQKLVLVVRGSAPPASLARLVSAGVFVAQTGPESALEVVAEMARLRGPGIVAVFEEGAGALPFTHRPGRGLEVDRSALESAVAEVSARRGQPGIVDLRHLESLLAVPAVPTGPTEGGGGLKTADQLAAWLLSRTDLVQIAFGEQPFDLLPAHGKIRIIFW